MTKLSYIFVVFLLFLSCTSNTILEQPKDLIPKEKMISIFVDLHIAQAGKGVKNLSEKRDENYFTLVYDKYQIDTTQFKISNEYYASLIDEYHLMFVEVEKRLTAIQDEALAAKKVDDSIKKVERQKSKDLTPREKLKEKIEQPKDIDGYIPLKRDTLSRQ